MNKKELIWAMSKANGLSQSVNAHVLDSFINVSTKTLKQGDSVRIPNFCTMTVSKRSASKGRNPATGETIKIPAYNRPHFKIGKGLKSAINK